MPIEKKFRTKTGFCHVLPDKIVLTRDGIVGNISAVVVGNKLTRILFIYGLVSVFSLYNSYQSFANGDVFSAIIFLALGVSLLHGILSSLNNSATPVVERKSIQKVIFKKAIPYLTRAYFVVEFVDEQGKKKKRLIMLPGSFSDGSEATKEAQEIMKEEKLVF